MMLRAASPYAEFIAARIRDARFWRRALFFLLIHIPLGLALYRSPALSTLHVLSIVGLAVAVAMAAEDPFKVALAGAYIMGSEVLWRMTDASFFWEGGKLACSLIFMIALVKAQFRGEASSGLKPLAGLYVLLLIPGVVITLIEMDLLLARKLISQNLTGPFSLMISVLFFSRLRLDKKRLCTVFVAALGPLLSIVAITIFTTYTATDIHWSTDSNFTTSGGFGPNQVSSSLSIGALFAFYILLVHGHSRLRRVFFFLILIVFSIQSVMTFSRTGIYLVLGSMGTTQLILWTQKRRLTGSSLKIIVIFLVAIFGLASMLNRFTEGYLGQRYRDTSTSNRYELGLADLGLFWEHPFFGVGIGQSPFKRRFSEHVANHTEFTRLLAEHGVFGAVAIFALGLMLLTNFRRRKDPLMRAMEIGLGAWVLMFFLVSGMRLLMPGYLFGLICITLVVPEAAEARESAPVRVGRPVPALGFPGGGARFRR